MTFSAVPARVWFVVAAVLIVAALTLGLPSFGSVMATSGVGVTAAPTPEPASASSHEYCIVCQARATPAPVTP